MYLHKLEAPEGANKKRKRIGRGESSGWGKTAGKGMDGQKSRTGKGKPKAGFEGGQMPMYRRMPKRGFVNIHAKRMAAVNVEMLNRFEAGSDINLKVLVKAGLASNRADGLRILGRGELTVSLNITADHFTGSAKTKVEGAGGKAIVIGGDAQAA